MINIHLAPFQKIFYDSSRQIKVGFLPSSYNETKDLVLSTQKQGKYPWDYISKYGISCVFFSLEFSLSLNLFSKEKERIYFYCRSIRRSK